ncbi:glycosyltransferase family 39 protein [Bacillus sp. MUM 13]|uniref:glycosyltransferase family 39 protein n=1 Tax=Bacillus sp. MUM 13 TaxID=1678001 RepID=UPI0008F5C414|nr:glycosyltransferase family 39 protein [Bacillus sp. MUM 13]OIK11811.1 glycosyl transferase [Bacillus sp. MUM 13]
MRRLVKGKMDFLLMLIILLSVFLNFYNLKNAGSNSYYSVAVKSMMTNFHAFFYASYDPAGFITVDKPPVALWIQTLCALIFGFSDFSVLLPEAAAGVFSVFLLYGIVKPYFGRTAALLSSLVLACSPIFVAVVRTNNVDSILISVLLLAAWVLMKSVQKEKPSWLMLSLVLLGIGFNVKMLQAFMVLPAFYLFYWIYVKIEWKKRFLHLFIATLVLFAVSLSWTIAVDSVPQNKRPYIGSSQTNSVLELALGYNGISRLTGQNNGMNNQSKQQNTNLEDSFSGFQSHNGGNPGYDGQDNIQKGPANMMRPVQSGGMFGTGNPGVQRLFSKELSGQISFLLPFVLFTMIGLIVTYRKGKVVTRQHKFALFWLAWLIPMMVFFSIAGFFHQYYLSMMAPSIAALTGIGWTVLWKLFRENEGMGRWLLPGGILASLLFEGLIVYQNKESVSLGWVFAAIVAGLLLFVTLAVFRGHKRYSRCLALASIFSLLAIPAYWTWITINKAGNAMIPSAGPSASFAGRNGFKPDGGQGRGRVLHLEKGQFANGNAGFSHQRTQQGSVPEDSAPSKYPKSNLNGTPPFWKMEDKTDSKLLSFLKKNRNSETYILAVQSSQEADSIMLQTDYAVMAMGGFSGNDPALTPGRLAKLAQSGKVKYFLISENGRGGDNQGKVNEWIRKHSRAVPESEWKSSKKSGMVPFSRKGSQSLYEYTGK